MKYYAVQKGLVPGIYTNWSECEANVKGVPGAIYKSFKSLEEAEAFLGKDGYEKQEEKEKKEKKEYPTINIEDYNGPIAFVDGSFNSSTGEYGYGVVIIEDTKNPVEIQLNGKDKNEKYLESMNIAGETLATKVAVSYAIANGYDHLTIFHDYEGIGKWAMGEWKANKDVAKDYKEFCDNIRSEIELQFVHVKGHSNNYYNDWVDALAKHALGIPLEKKKFEDIIRTQIDDLDGIEM